MTPAREPNAGRGGHVKSDSPLITLLTDFGDRDGFVGVVKGVLLTRCPTARLVDLSHEVLPQDVLGGALILASAVDFFPPKTVHLAVVDPGVGTERRPLVIETRDFLLVGPDNGLLSLAAERSPVRRVVHLDRPEHFLSTTSRTFHARDVFAPVAALAASGLPLTRLGSEVENFERLSLPAPRRTDEGVEGQVIHVDRFGNLISNVRAEDLTGFRQSEVLISIRGVQISGLASNYSAVRAGRPLALWNSWGRLEIAVRNDSAARHLRARVGDRVEVRARSLGRGADS